jgi:hypothetical protein
MIEPELSAMLKTVKAQEGIPEAEQIRRALREWFKQREKGSRKTAPRRGGTRRRA